MATLGLACLAHDIPDDARRQIGLLAAAQGLQAAAFAPAGGWVVVGRADDDPPSSPGEPAVFAARGIPDGCFVRLRGFVADGQAIRWIGLSAAEGIDRWVVLTDRGYAAGGIPDDCFAALVQGWDHGLRPSCIAFPPAVGDGEDDGRGWLMLAGRTVLGRGVDAACWQRLNNLAQGLRPARQVAFTPGGGWAIVADDGVSTHGLPAACRAHVGQVAQTHLVEQLCFTSNGGWLVASATPKIAAPVDPLREFEQHFRLVAGRWCSLADRMAAHRVTGVSAAAAVDGRLAWATRYGPDNPRGGSDERLFDAERRLAMRDALLAMGTADVSHDFADTRCLLRRWPAERAACVVLADGGDEAGRAALAEEAVEALVRSHGWDRWAMRLAG